MSITPFIRATRHLTDPPLHFHLGNAEHAIIVFAPISRVGTDLTERLEP